MSNECVLFIVISVRKNFIGGKMYAFSICLFEELQVNDLIEASHITIVFRKY